MIVGFLTGWDVAGFKTVVAGSSAFSLINFFLPLRDFLWRSSMLITAFKLLEQPCAACKRRSSLDDIDFERFWAVGNFEAPGGSSDCGTTALSKCIFFRVWRDVALVEASLSLFSLGQPSAVKLSTVPSVAFKFWSFLNDFDLERFFLANISSSDSWLEGSFAVLISEFCFFVWKNTLKTPKPKKHMSG